MSTPRVLAVHGHAQPVGSLLAPHLLDALGAGAHVFAIAHRCQNAEEEPEIERQVLVKAEGLTRVG